mmetsp:Transcript_20267/g.51509  ORF Transcript_20267/g.51509 Transcript_20267/m.51509 type:complete len:266 (-) Transcript_20267:284-1081(-)
MAPPRFEEMGEEMLPSPRGEQEQGERVSATLRLQGNAFYAEGRLALAVETYRQALAENLAPHDRTDLIASLALVQLKQGDALAAAQTLAMADAQPSERLLRAAVKAYQALGDEAGAHGAKLALREAKAAAASPARPAVPLADRRVATEPPLQPLPQPQLRAASTPPKVEAQRSPPPQPTETAVGAPEAAAQLGTGGANASQPTPQLPTQLPPTQLTLLTQLSSSATHSNGSLSQLSSSATHGNGSVLSAAVLSSEAEAQLAGAGV